MKIHKFKAKIQAGDRGGAYVLFPFDVEKAFGIKGKVAVKGAFNGVPFSGSLIKYGRPLHNDRVAIEFRSSERFGQV